MLRDHANTNVPSVISATTGFASNSTSFESVIPFGPQSEFPFWSIR